MTIKKALICDDSSTDLESLRTILDQAGVDPQRIGCLIHASVCRDFLEPATASRVHHGLSLPRQCWVYDVSNACLGLINGAVQIAMMIQSGAIGETSGSWGITKTGAGTLTLSGANTYTGDTVLTDGTLIVSQDNNLGASSGGVIFDGGALRLGASFDLAGTRSVTRGHPWHVHEVVVVSVPREDHTSPAHVVLPHVPVDLYGIRFDGGQAGAQEAGVGEERCCQNHVRAVLDDPAAAPEINESEFVRARRG